MEPRVGWFDPSSTFTAKVFEDFYEIPQDPDMGEVSYAVREASGIDTMMLKPLKKAGGCASTAMAVTREIAIEKGESVAEAVSEQGQVVFTMVKNKGESVAEAVSEQGQVVFTMVKNKGESVAEVVTEHGPVVGTMVQKTGKLVAEVVTEQGPVAFTMLQNTGESVAEAVSEHGPVVVTLVKEAGKLVAEVVSEQGQVVGTMVMDFGYSAIEAATAVSLEELLTQAWQLSGHSKLESRPRVVLQCLWWAT